MPPLTLKVVPVAPLNAPLPSVKEPARPVNETPLVPPVVVTEVKPVKVASVVAVPLVVIINP